MGDSLPTSRVTNVAFNECDEREQNRRVWVQISIDIAGGVSGLLRAGGIG